MNLVQWLAVKFEEENIDYTQWPEDTDAEQNNYEVEIEGWDVDLLCCEGDFKYQGEYDDSESCTREDFFDFIEKNPTFGKGILDKRKTSIGRIAQLNKVAYGAVEEALKLSEEVGLPYTCSMPSGVADLDENSDWDASRC